MLDKISLAELPKDESRSFEVWVEGYRWITISINKYGTSIEMPASKGTVSVHESEGSFYAHHKLLAVCIDCEQPYIIEG